MVGLRQVLCLVAGMLITPVLGRAADVQVSVLNVADATGRIRVAVCAAPEWLKSDCAHNANSPARPGLLVITVRHVPPGIYGVQAHHDRNGDGRIDQNLFGIPTEGIGFSRNAPIRFGPPRFADAAVQINETQNMVDVTLLFEPDGARP